MELGHLRSVEQRDQAIFSQKLLNRDGYVSYWGNSPPKSRLSKMTVELPCYCRTNKEQIHPEHADSTFLDSHVRRFDSDLNDSI
ncbi:hypothetical protein J6590_044631 [Homalodisca vitripennis]|nr:hypothetical protein J6590_044631 [Homalodisca vitripennis]